MNKHSNEVNKLIDEKALQCLVFTLLVLQPASQQYVHSKIKKSGLRLGEDTLMTCSALACFAQSVLMCSCY